ncbi:maleylpyruvate isomerase family mycothiol-dependent enzyme [Nocardioides sp. KC13]|uniref:Maleylpyruvate isomerase family mycothiol-dependent enzyme n=1 Tax=Nocardioides turkmenicus TaxID=2711220 RepID=A0A6M1RBY7_9ACTN|nr:maleylpyruvate isomerase family mycothiol-dependent enzyme [Nocardioides sp. KC13]NGN93887.1 maleylpyruvate isomerase family mycothiol-dependent enzyme [Nocardioides sp. KC13]
MSSKSAIWSVVHAEREALIRDLETLAPARWTTPSLCAGWTVHDVLAHMIDVATTTRLGFVRRMIAARGDFDRDNQTGVDRERADDPAETLAAYRRVAGRTATPPAPLATRLVEEFAHGEDIRRPLGIERDYPVEHVVTALRYLADTSQKWGGGKERAQRVRLVATDADAVIGTGPEVRGTAIALVLALSGRPVEPGELTGPGRW